jgi:hypothetical protein
MLLWYFFLSSISLIFIYIQPKISNIIMQSVIFIGIVAMMAIAVTTVSLGFGLASAQMADNATMGNMTMGTGNMTSGNSTETTGKVSGFGGVL